MKFWERIKIFFNGSTTVLLFIVAFLIMSLFAMYKTDFNTLEDPKKISKEEVDSLKKEMCKYKYHIYQEKLTDMIEEYIDRNSQGSIISADTIVKYSLKYDVSVSFVLAQAQVESHFGTRGIAKRTNSVFNVGTFDNGDILYKYNHPNQSIEPYIKLLKQDYLIDGKDVQDLMKTNNFVNHSGYRYASNNHYEYQIRRTYNEIKDSTKIALVEDKIKNLPIKNIKTINL